MTTECEGCRGFNPNHPIYGKIWITGPVFEHNYLPIVHIIEGEREGCRYCSLLIRVIENFVPNWESMKDQIYFHVIAPNGRPFQMMILGPPLPDGESAELANVHLSTLEGVDIPGFPNLGKTRMVAQSSADPQNIQFVQDCLRKCSLHDRCHSPGDNLLPKRLINLGPDNQSLSLYESSQEKGCYAALSYCWGKSGTLLKTTESNLKTFKDHVTWDKFPRTLQDAIIITRQIGLKFIWIDCLCIIQDSRLDWEAESAKMHLYYRNAFITIGASSSPNSGSGILVHRPSVSKPKEIRFSGPGPLHYSVLAQNRKEPLWPSTIWQLGPLSERAWTLQEHALSTRMLHFTDAEVIWECNTEMISEDGHPIRNNNHGLIKELQRKLKEHPENCWRVFVRAYSERSLTFLNDKLMAIAGIAAYFQRQTSFQYLAGLWKETLPIDLVWTSWGWENIDKPPSIIQAPSWSWASIHGGIAFNAETISKSAFIKIHCIIEDVQYIIPHGNSFGLIKEGKIEITGPMIEAELEFKGEYDDYGIPSFRLSRKGFSDPLFSPDTSLEHVEIEDEDGAQYWTIQRTANLPTPFRTKVWCLWRFAADEKPSELQVMLKKELTKLHGIVLARSSASLSIYHRIGSVSVENSALIDAAEMKKISII